MRQDIDASKRMTVKEFLEAIMNLEETIYEIQITNKFKKSLDLSYRRNLDLKLLKDVTHTLAKGEKLEAKHRPHTLEGFKTVVWERLDFASCFYPIFGSVNNCYSSICYIFQSLFQTGFFTGCQTKRLYYSNHLLCLFILSIVF